MKNTKAKKNRVPRQKKKEEVEKIKNIKKEGEKKRKKKPTTTKSAKPHTLRLSIPRDLERTCALKEF